MLHIFGDAMNQYEVGERGGLAEKKSLEEAMRILCRPLLCPHLVPFLLSARLASVQESTQSSTSVAPIQE